MVRASRHHTDRQPPSAWQPVPFSLSRPPGFGSLRPCRARGLLGQRSSGPPTTTRARYRRVAVACSWCARRHRAWLLGSTVAQVSVTPVAFPWDLGEPDFIMRATLAQSAGWTPRPRRRFARHLQHIASPRTRRAAVPGSVHRRTPLAPSILALTSVRRTTASTRVAPSAGPPIAPTAPLRVGPSLGCVTSSGRLQGCSPS